MHHQLVAKWNEDGDDFIWESETFKTVRHNERLNTQKIYKNKKYNKFFLS